MRVFVVSLLLAALGCSTEARAQNDAGPLWLGVTELNADTLEGPRPALTLRTVSDFHFDPYRLDVDVRRSGSTFDLVVRGFVEPGNSATHGIEAATFETPVDLSDGVYRVRVRSGGVRDEFRLLVSDDRFEIVSVQARITTVPETLVWRLLERSFVYTCSTVRGHEALCDRFRARLEADLVLTPVAVPPLGVWPYHRGASGGRRYHALSRVYRYNSEADFDRAKEMLRAFTAEALRDQTGDQLAVQNWRGGWGQSWMYARE